MPPSRLQLTGVSFDGHSNGTFIWATASELLMAHIHLWREFSHAASATCLSQQSPSKQSCISNEKVRAAEKKGRDNDGGADVHVDESMEGWGRKKTTSGYDYRDIKYILQGNLNKKTEKENLKSPPASMSSEGCLLSSLLSLLLVLSLSSESLIPSLSLKDHFKLFWIPYAF
jgi:hypothetical protein